MNWFDDQLIKNCKTESPFYSHYDQHRQMIYQKEQENRFLRELEEEWKKSDELIKINLEKEKLNKRKLLL